MVAQFENPTVTYGPAMTKMLDACPQAIEQSNGWWSNEDNPRFDFREDEDGHITIKSWTGRTQDEILAMIGLKVADIYPRGYKTVKVRASLDVLELAHAKCIPWQFLFNLGLQSDYRYHGYSNVKIPYFLADGTQHTKNKVRKAIEGEYKHSWDENTPGDIIPYGLHMLHMAREAGYLTLGEGETDGWANWYNGVPYLGVPGADMQKTLKHLDVSLLPPKVYILLESDQKQKLLDNGQGFYKNIHQELRKNSYAGEIFCIDFKKATGHKDPSDLHIALWKDGKVDRFKEIIHQAMEQAIPANDEQEEIAPTFVIQDERVLKALVEKKLQVLYALAPEIADMPDIEQSRIILAAQSVWKNDFSSREFKELLKATKIQNELSRQPGPDYITARDLMKLHFEPVDFVVPDILPTGLIVLGGKQKIGKSWFDLNVCLSVAYGGIALGKYKVEQGDVLYMALEDHQRRLQDRMSQLLTPDSEAPESLEIVTQWRRMDEGGLTDLEDWLQKHPKARLVMIDPWILVKPKIKGRPGETGYDADYEALKGIKKLADDYKVCILVQFHLRKAIADDPFDELNATTGVTACADGFISLKRTRGEEEGTLFASGRDYKEEVNLALSFKNGEWKVLGEGQTAVYYTLSQERKAIIDLLCNTVDPYGIIQPMMPKDIASLLDIKDGTIRRILQKMKEDGQVKWVEEDKEKDARGGYISLIPSPKVQQQQENNNANPGNGGNDGNSGNGGNGGNASQSEDNFETYQAQTVTDDSESPAEFEGDSVPGVTSVTAVTAVTTDSNFEEDITSPLPMELLQEYHTLYKQLQQVPPEELAPLGEIHWHVPGSDLPNGFVSRNEYAIRLQALYKSGDMRKMSAGRDEMRRKLGRGEK